MLPIVKFSFCIFYFRLLQLQTAENAIFLVMEHNDSLQQGWATPQVSHVFSIPSKHSWLIKLHSKLKFMIRWLLESGVLSVDRAKLWHQSGSQRLKLPTPAQHNDSLFCHINWNWVNYSNFSNQDFIKGILMDFDIEALFLLPHN
jgi:hypothetical protein